MKIRTFYWHDGVVSRAGHFARALLRSDTSRFFVVGNAGDILTNQLIQRIYGCASMNIADKGRRLLLTGSVAQRMLHGDVLCGVGVKTRSIPKAGDISVLVWALRGPISYELFRAAGHNVGDVRFLLDPGLLLRFMLRQEVETIKPRGVAFIPHFRERGRYQGRLPNGIRLIDIDDHPENVGRAILKAELIYASSLHGIIFSHALNRPVVFVRPQTEEPLLKYEDYFASVNIGMNKPLSSIDDADYLSSPTTPADINYQESDFIFPELSMLRERGIVINS